jgi:large subunit ribosomal protein L10
VALAREDKERIVQEVKEVSASASSLVISDARGLKVSELTEIRKQGTESGVHIQVIKTLLQNWHLKALTLVALMKC